MIEKLSDKLRQHILESAGYNFTADYSYIYLKKSQWSSIFESLMKNRLIIGGLRYGLIKDSNNFDNIGSIEKRIKAYKKDKNLEHLVDIANLCMVEFETQDIAKLKPIQKQKNRVVKK